MAPTSTNDGGLAKHTSTCTGEIEWENVKVMARKEEWTRHKFLHLIETVKENNKGVILKNNFNQSTLYLFFKNLKNNSYVISVLFHRFGIYTKLFFRILVIVYCLQWLFVISEWWLIYNFHFAGKRSTMVMMTKTWTNKSLKNSPYGCASQIIV